MERRADEIIILRRFSGYVRFHIPALLYSGKAAYLLEKELKVIEGVRKISVKKEMGKISVFYDSIMAPEDEILLAVDRVATPLLRPDQQESYEVKLSEVQTARNRRLARKVVVAVILTYLIKVHWRLISRQWLRDPITHWPKLLSIAVLIYIHRKHIRGAGSFD